MSEELYGLAEVMETLLIHPGDRLIIENGKVVDIIIKEVYEARHDHIKEIRAALQASKEKQSGN